MRLTYDASVVGQSSSFVLDILDKTLMSPEMLNSFWTGSSLILIEVVGIYILETEQSTILKGMYRLIP